MEHKGQGNEKINRQYGSLFFTALIETLTITDSLLKEYQVTGIAYWVLNGVGILLGFIIFFLLKKLFQVYG